MRPRTALARRRTPPPPTYQGQAHGSSGAHGWLLALGLTALLFAAPPLALLAAPEGRDALARVLGGGAVVLRNTVAVGVGVAGAGTLLAWVCAHAYHHHSYRGRRVAHALCLAPLLLPPPTIALALVALAGQGGLLTRSWGLGSGLYGPLGVTLAATLSALPYAYIVLLHGLGLQDRRLAEAAVDLGASRARILGRELAGLRPVAAIAALMLFAEAVTDLADPLVVGGGFTTVSTRLFEAATAENDLADAVVHGALLVGASLLVAAVVGRLGGTGLPAVRRESAGRAATRDAWSRLAVATHLGVGGVVALAVLVVAVGASGGLSGGLDAGHLRAVLDGPFQVALADTVFAGLLATLLTLPAGLALGARLAARQGGHLHRLTAALAAVPPLAYGLAAWVALTQSSARLTQALPSGAPVVEAQTWFFLVAVAVLSSLPGNALTVADRLRRLPPGDLEAARSLGARRLDELRDVVVPHLRPLIGGQAPATLARSLSSLAPAALLATSRTPLLPVELVTSAEAGRVGDACAIALVMGAIIAGAASLSAAPREPTARALRP